MKPLILSILMFMVSAACVFATAQYPDKIVLDGKEYILHTNPMEPYFAKHPDKKPNGGLMSTALWRGYVATFEFKTNCLVLKDIEIMTWNESEDGKHETSWKSAKDDVIPKGEDLPVDWFTGILVLPNGKLVNYVHMGYGSSYSDYILLEVKQGKLTGRRNLDHNQYDKFKEEQFQAYKKTEDYSKRAEELKDKKWAQQDIDAFLRSYVLNYTSEFLDKEEKKEPAQKVTESDKK